MSLWSVADGLAPDASVPHGLAPDGPDAPDPHHPVLDDPAWPEPPDEADPESE